MASPTVSVAGSASMKAPPKYGFMVENTLCLWSYRVTFKSGRVLEALYSIESLTAALEHEANSTGTVFTVNKHPLYFQFHTAIIPKAEVEYISQVLIKSPFN